MEGAPGKKPLKENAPHSRPFEIMRNSELGIQLLVASAVGLPVLILLGYVGLRQFRLLLTVVSELSASRSRLPAFLRPYLRKVNANFEQSFGAHDKFTPNLTHVLLAAIVLSILLLTIRSGLPNRR